MSARDSRVRMTAQQRYRAISERRLRRLLGRRQALVSQIEDLRNARDYLTNIDRRYSSNANVQDGDIPMQSLVHTTTTPNNPSNNLQNVQQDQISMRENSRDFTLRNTSATPSPNSNGGEITERDGTPQTRVIDEWARVRRGRIEFDRRRNLQSDSYQIRRSYNHYGTFSSRLSRNNSSSNSMTQGRNIEQSQSEQTMSDERRLNTSGNQPTLPSIAIEPNVVAFPESSFHTSLEFPNARQHLDVVSNGNETEEMRTNTSETAAARAGPSTISTSNLLVTTVDDQLNSSRVPDGSDIENMSSTSETSNNLSVGGSNLNSELTSSVEPTQNLSNLDVSNANNNQQQNIGEPVHNDHTYSNQEGLENVETQSDVHVINESSQSPPPNADFHSDANIATNPDTNHDDAGRVANDPTTVDNVNSTETGTDAAVTRSNLDIILLSRHIEHMQTICRASLADCNLNRHRRQVVRLQSIRRMLEDLQRQIRCLRAASYEELSRRSREAESLGSVLGNVRQRNRRRWVIERPHGRRNSINSSSTLANLSFDQTNDEERDEEEEGHFDLVDEDAFTPDNNLTSEEINQGERLNNEGERMNPLNNRITRFGALNRSQIASRSASITSQLRARTLTRGSRTSGSGRLGRIGGTSDLLSIPRVYRHPRRVHVSENGNSSEIRPNLRRMLRNRTSSSRAIVPESTTFGNANIFYRGRPGRNRIPNVYNPVAPGCMIRERHLAGTRRTRLSRAHLQLPSQLKTAIRALETSPNSAVSDNSNENLSTVEARQSVMEKPIIPSKMATDKDEEKIKKQPQSPGSGTKEELRALSQRMEKILKDRREKRCLDSQLGQADNDSSGVLSVGAENMSHTNEDNTDSLSEGARYLMSLPRPDTGLTSPNGTSLSDPRLRWRHLMEGIDDNILNDPMPPRRNMRYVFQRQSSINRDHDFYIRSNYRSQRRDSSPLVGRLRSSRLIQPINSPSVDGTLQSADIETDSGSDTDEAALSFNETRNFPHNSSLEWNGGTSSSPLFRHGFGRWPIRRMSRREEFSDIYGYGHSVTRAQDIQPGAANLSEGYGSEEIDRELGELQRSSRNPEILRRRMIELRRALNRRNEGERPVQEPMLRSRNLLSSVSPTPVIVSSNPSFGNEEHHGEQQGIPFSEHDQSVDVDTEASDGGTFDMDRLPPLRELIWRRLRRRNAQLNMLEDEIADSNTSMPNTNIANVDTSYRAHNSNADSVRTSNNSLPAQDVSRPHREFLSFMVDQMRLDHESAATSQIVPRRVNTMDDQESGVLNSNETVSEVEGGRGTRDIPTHHISFSREFITPPPIQYRRRYLNLMGENINNDNPIVTVNGNHAPEVRRVVQEVRSRPFTYAAAAASGANLTQQHAVGSSVSPNPQANASAANFQREHYYLHNAPANMLLTHRIQSWDFTRGDIPDLRDSSSNLVVNEARIHNDASVDISEDGSILVTLIPSTMPMTTVVGVYGLRPYANRGRCYATYK